MKAREIRDLSSTELQKRVRETRRDLLMLRLRRQTGQVEKTNELRSLRKDIARMETILTEKSTSEPAAAS